MQDQEKRCQKWEKTRQMGRQRFVWLIVIIFAFIGTVCVEILDFVNTKNWDELLSLLSRLFGFSLPGLAWGYFTWRDNEKKYRQYLERNGAVIETKQQREGAGNGCLSLFLKSMERIRSEMRP